MKFTIFDANDGRVVFSGTADDPATLAQPGQEVFLGESYDSGYFLGEAHYPLPDQPSERHVFNYTTKQWEDPRTHQTQWPVVRAERDAKLAASDWTQLPDVPLATKEAWAVYRQALRDVTLQSDPFAIDWPVAPGA